MLKPSDLRIRGFREHKIHWHGVYTITHVPSGKSVTFRCRWDDRSEPRERALAELDRIVSHREPLSAPDTLKCHCGVTAVIAYTPGGTRPSQFFCETHQAEAEALLRSSGRQ